MEKSKNTFEMRELKTWQDKLFNFLPPIILVLFFIMVFAFVALPTAVTPILGIPVDIMYRSKLLSQSIQVAYCFIGFIGVAFSVVSLISACTYKNANNPRRNLFTTGIISAIFYFMFLVIVSIGISEIRSMGADVGACLILIIVFSCLFFATQISLLATNYIYIRKNGYEGIVCSIKKALVLIKTNREKRKVEKQTLFRQINKVYNFLPSILMMLFCGLTFIFCALPIANLLGVDSKNLYEIATEDENGFIAMIVVFALQSIYALFCFINSFRTSMVKESCVIFKHFASKNTLLSMVGIVIYCATLICSIIGICYVLGKPLVGLGLCFILMLVFSILFLIVSTVVFLMQFFKLKKQPEGER